VNPAGGREPNRPLIQPMARTQTQAGAGESGRTKYSSRKGQGRYLKKALCITPKRARSRLPTNLIMNVCARSQKKCCQLVCRAGSVLAIAATSRYAANCSVKTGHATHNGARRTMGDKGRPEKKHRSAVAGCWPLIAGNLNVPGRTVRADRLLTH